MTKNGKNRFCKKSSWVPLSILTPVALFYIQMKNFYRQKWSAREALQTVKVWANSEVVTVTVVETPWKYPYAKLYLVLDFDFECIWSHKAHEQCTLLYFLLLLLLGCSPFWDKVLYIIQCTINQKKHRSVIRFLENSNWPFPDPVICKEISKHIFYQRMSAYHQLFTSWLLIARLTDPNNLGFLCAIMWSSFPTSSTKNVGVPITISLSHDVIFFSCIIQLYCIA
jgi:hypothetical protein